MKTFFKSNSPDEEITTGLLAGGMQRRSAEKKLFERFLYFIKQGSLKYSIPEEEAVSAYSDTVISVIENIVTSKFEGRSTLKSYTYQIFINKCIDVVRKRTTNKSKVYYTSAIDDLLAALPDKTKNIIEQIIETTQRTELMNKLEEIGAKCKQMLLLFEDGYSDKEIAVLMHYNSPNVVKTSRLRCLLKLKEKINIRNF